MRMDTDELIETFELLGDWEERYRYRKGGRTCPECGKVMSLQPNQVKNREHNFCSHKCYSLWWSRNKRGEKANRWAGGRRVNEGGYVDIRLQPDDFFYPMTNSPRKSFIYIYS